MPEIHVDARPRLTVPEERPAVGERKADEDVEAAFGGLGRQPQIIRPPEWYHRLVRQRYDDCSVDGRDDARSPIMCRRLIEFLRRGEGAGDKAREEEENVRCGGLGGGEELEWDAFKLVDDRGHGGGDGCLSARKRSRRA